MGDYRLKRRGDLRRNISYNAPDNKQEKEEPKDIWQDINKNEETPF